MNNMKTILLTTGFMATLFSVSSLQAATIQVNTTTDDFRSRNSMCSIREAVEMINTQGAASFSECTNTGNPYGQDDTIQLQMNQVYCLSSGGYINLNQDVVIEGEGSVIDGGYNTNNGCSALNDLLFFVKDTADVTMRSVTLTGGRHVSVNGGSLYGGAIAVYTTAALTLEAVKVDGNVVESDGAGAYGGGIGSAGTLTLRDSYVVNNRIRSGTNNVFGGGVYSNGTTVLESVVISGNEADANNNAAFGGGLYLGTDAVVDVIYSLIDSNSVVSGTDIAYGGGVAWQQSDQVYFQDSSISNNRASGASGAHGGGFYVNIYSAANSPLLHFENSDVTGNSAESSGGNVSGGGIFMGSSTVLEMVTTSVNSNISLTAQGTSQGGGIYLEGLNDFSMSESTIGRNTAQTSSNSLAEGGGIYNNGGRVNVVNATISNNQASSSLGQAQGGGLSLYNHTINTLTVSNSTIAENSAWGRSTSYAGGIYLNQATYEMKSSVLAANLSTSSPDCYNATSGTGGFQSHGYNFFQSSINSCQVYDLSNRGTNILGMTASALRLGALNNYGGNTETHSIRRGSAAINAGSCTTIQNYNLTADQRGVARTGSCDMGSYEY